MSAFNDRAGWMLITTALVTLGVLLWVGNGCWMVVVDRLVNTSRTKPKPPHDSVP